MSSVSQLALRYKAKYKKQIELNQYLNAYTKNVRIAYGGHNTVHFQLPNSTTSQEVALRAYCEDEDDDEVCSLSLGHIAHKYRRFPLVPNSKHMWDSLPITGRYVVGCNVTVHVLTGGRLVGHAPSRRSTHEELLRFAGSCVL